MKRCDAVHGSGRHKSHLSPIPWAPYRCRAVSNTNREPGPASSEITQNLFVDRFSLDRGYPAACEEGDRCLWQFGLAKAQVSAPNVPWRAQDSTVTEIDRGSTLALRCSTMSRWAALLAKRMRRYLCRNVKRFRGGRVMKADRLWCHSTLCSRVIKANKEDLCRQRKTRCGLPRPPGEWPRRGGCGLSRPTLDVFLGLPHMCQ